MVNDGLERAEMSTRRVPNPGAKRASGRAAILAYVLRNAKLIGRDDAGRNVISLSIDAWLMAQLVAAKAMASPANRTGQFVPEVSAVESARVA
jgi:hypothetical protein